MANNCGNWAEISGDFDVIHKIKKDIEEALAYGEAEHFWYKSFCKMFDIETEDVYNTFGSKWYECYINDITSIKSNSEKSFMIIAGDSAWSPPVGFYVELSKKYNIKVSAEYEEPGMDFGGFFECENGEVTRDECISYTKYRLICDPYYAMQFAEDVIEYDDVKSFRELKAILEKEGIKITAPIFSPDCINRLKRLIKNQNEC